MTGQPERALVFHCRSSSIQEKLLGIYANLLSSHALPFPLHLQMDVSSTNLSGCVRDRQCLFFVEASSDNDVQNVKQAMSHYAHLGHQMVLIADSRLDYLDLAMRYNIGNILYEDRFDAAMIAALTRRLLGDEFFGFAPFFPSTTPLFNKTYSLSGQVHSHNLIDRVFGDFMARLEHHHALNFRTHAAELIMNALAYGVVGITPEQRDREAQFISAETLIPEGKEIYIHIVQDEEKYGISVKDPGGTLTLSRILSKIRRHTPAPGEVIPPGVCDLTGRGLFLISRQTRLVFNIYSSVATEAILLYYFDESRNHYQSLIVNEKVPARSLHAPAPLTP